VRLEISGEVLHGLVARLCKALKLDSNEDVYQGQRSAQLRRSAASFCATSVRELRDEPFSPQIVPRFASQTTSSR